jgi:hypothetical protein
MDTDINSEILGTHGGFQVTHGYLGTPVENHLSTYCARISLSVSNWVLGNRGQIKDPLE